MIAPGQLPFAPRPIRGEVLSSWLMRVTDPAVRSLAFELVRTRAEHRALATDLLSQNFQPGDHDTVVNWFETEEDIETLHREGQSLVDFWKNHPSDGLYTRMLCSLYEKGPCSFCRERAVASLLERGALSNLSLERFRTSIKYQDRPAAADIAFCVAAYANGMTEDRIERAIEDDYLSRDPSPTKRAAYVRRTMEKARRWTGR
jgi:hypothetical protein